MDDPFHPIPGGDAHAAGPLGQRLRRASPAEGTRLQPAVQRQDDRGQPASDRDGQFAYLNDQAAETDAASEAGEPADAQTADDHWSVDDDGDTGDADPASGDGPAGAGARGGDEVAEGPGEESLAVYGDAAYGSGELIAELEAAGAQVMVKVQPPVAPAGRYAKDRFVIDTDAGTVTCPAKVTVPISPARAGGTAGFGAVFASCPLAADCTASRAGRTITISRYEAELTRARATQQDQAWRQEYRATRPKVERKIGHLMRRKHGGRRVQVRGRTKVAADFSLLAAAANLARLAALRITDIARTEPARAPA